MNLLNLNNTWQRLAVLCFAMLGLLVLSSCGGKGAGANGSGTVASFSAADMSLLTDEPTLSSDGRTSATLTAIVKNDSNVALAQQPVVFSTNDPGAIIQVIDNVTDAQGMATAVLTISDTSVRTIRVTAQSGTITRTVDIPVVGTVLSISGSNTIVFNSPTQFSLSLRDSSGSPITNAPVTITSAAGNIVTPTSLATDALGQAAFQVTGAVNGADTLTATAQGVSSTFQTAVSGKQVKFLADILPRPVPDTEPLNADINVLTTINVTILVEQNGAPLGGELVQFAATRGTLSANSATTDGAGQATVTITSSSSGISTITATASGTTGTKQVEFVSNTPTKLALQASPAVVGANLDVNGTKSSQLIAVARDAADNPVKGVRVDFTSIADPSNGRIEPGFGTTDSFGTATASFIAGPNPTGPGQVVVQAALPAYGIQSQTTLTVSELELSVIIGTGNEIETISTTAYQMPWSAIVADSSGNPVDNAAVTAAIESTRYRKGRWVEDFIGGGWIIPTGPPDAPTVCLSEDTNINGRLDIGEDINNNGALTPGSPAVASVIGTGTTDENGVAEVRITYPKDAGQWTEAKLTVTITTTAGTEGTASSVFWLPVQQDDLQVLAIPPPGANAPVSLYGEATSCTNPN